MGLNASLRHRRRSGWQARRTLIGAHAAPACAVLDWPQSWALFVGVCCGVGQTTPPPFRPRARPSQPPPKKKQPLPQSPHCCTGRQGRTAGNVARLPDSLRSPLRSCAPAGSPGWGFQPASLLSGGSPCFLCFASSSSLSRSLCSPLGLPPPSLAPSSRRLLLPPGLLRLSAFAAPLLRLLRAPPSFSPASVRPRSQPAPPFCVSRADIRARTPRPDPKPGRSALRGIMDKCERRTCHNCIVRSYPTNTAPDHSRTPRRTPSARRLRSAGRGRQRGGRPACSIRYAQGYAPASKRPRLRPTLRSRRSTHSRRALPCAPLAASAGQRPAASRPAWTPPHAAAWRLWPQTPSHTPHPCRPCRHMRP